MTVVLFLSGKVSEMLIGELNTRQKNALEKKGITNAGQLKRFAPIRYIDNRKETGLKMELVESHAVVIGTMTNCRLADMSGTFRKYISCTVTDRLSGQTLKISVFGQFYAYKTIREWLDSQVIVCGKLGYLENYGYVMANPDTFSDVITGSLRYVPVYSKIKGVSDETLEALLDTAFEEDEDDTMPEEILSQNGLCGINDALSGIMRPACPEDVGKGKRRLLFDDMFYLAARFVISERKSFVPGVRIESSEIPDSVIRSLPYSLTSDQHDTYMSIREKLLRGQHFKALIQGDVGCGKTITAFLAMLLVAGEGHQACLMAPTQILAEQHFEKLKAIANQYGISCVLIEGGKSNKSELKSLKDGSALLAVGTHGLISDKVVFKDLALFVTDEEHKFGVKQREAVEKKKDLVNCISMSATPIPRTLANAVYGNDVDIYSIKEMPNGRKPIKTYYDRGNKVIPFLKKVLDHGNQAYAVCPLIDEADEDSIMSGTLSTEKAFDVYSKHLPGYSIAVLTGTTSAEETEKILTDFRENRIQLLISTTVVEVGVDVPNAALMIIHNAERFGLAGMHQLRGRVGRGDIQSYCILVSKESPLSNERLMTMCRTTDGFEIAEQDMKFLRKSGDLFGTQQSGKNKYIEEMVLHKDVYDSAFESAKLADTVTLNRHIEKIRGLD